MTGPFGFQSRINHDSKGSGEWKSIEYIFPLDFNIKVRHCVTIGGTDEADLVLLLSRKCEFDNRERI